MLHNDIKYSTIHTAMQSLTPLLSNKRCSRPVQYRTGNPRGGFPRVRGSLDYVSFSQPAGALSPGAPGMPISPKLAPTDTPGVTRRPPTFTDRLLPNRSLYAFTHTWYTKTCPGFHRTAVILSRLSLYRCYAVRAFTVPLLCCPGFHRTAVILSM